MVPITIISRIGVIEGLKPSAHVESIIAFLENHLVGFIHLYNKKYIGVSNEIAITQKLEFYLSPFLKEEISSFNLTKEYVEDTYAVKKSPQSDLAFYLDGDDEAFFCIEAKRLSGNSKEYVFSQTGKTGGIERFKKGIHGSGLKYSAIIGYVQKNDFSFWFSKINCWIDELIQDEKQDIKWTEEDKLTKIYFEQKKAKLISKNKRRKDYIFLYHFWIDLR